MGPSGAVSGKIWWAINVAALLVFPFVLTSCSSVASALSPTSTPVSSVEPKIIEVLVVDNESKSLKNAVVRVIGTLQVDDNDDGGYWLQYCINGQFISAWALGYAIQWEPCETGRKEYTVKLIPLAVNHNVTYSWISAFGSGMANCMQCHSDPERQNEYNEWIKDGHSKVFTDPYFSTIYTGKDVNRNQSDQTIWGILSTGRQVRHQNTSKYGPGYLLDYPNDQGNCAYCHAPAMVQGETEIGNLKDVIGNFSGIATDAKTEGITCDVCHKVIGVAVNDGELPYPDRPGVLSLSYMLPDPGGSFAIGSTENLLPTTSAKLSCSPVFSESRFCAACHYGKFFNTVVYNSYGEWLASSYHEVEKTGEGVKKEPNPGYRSCQDCHMLSPEQIGNTLPGERSACSTTNQSFQDFNHNMMKYGNGKYNSFPNVPQLIEDAASLKVESKYNKDANLITVIVKVTNEKAGHKFPTDSPLRHLILIVEARDELGNTLPQASGGIIPVWGGVGKSIPGMENYGGMPGKVFAFLLADSDTGAFPTAAYWNPTELVSSGPGNTSDNRLKPGLPDESTYSFSILAKGNINITVKLMYRYAFIDLAAQKSWTRPDILVTSTQCTMDSKHVETLECK